MKKLENIGEWKIGNHLATVVSTEKIKNKLFPCPPNVRESQDDALDYYGGYLICESIGDPDMSKLISAAPDMYKALNLVVDAFKTSGYYLPVTVMDAVNDAIFKADGITKVEFDEEYFLPT